MLVAADRNGRHAQFFGLHVWGDLLHDGLAAVRKADLEGIALNKKKLTVRFGLDDAIDGDVVDWIRRHMEAVGEDYRTMKRKLLETAGYEHGFGTGKFTIEAPTNEHITNAFLGLGDGVEVKQFLFTPERFGIASNKPLIDAQFGKLFIDPEPSGTCDIRVRGNTADPSITLQGNVFSFLPPGLPREATWLRFAAAPLDIVWNQNEPSRVNLTLKPDKAYSIDQLWAYVQICRWSRDGQTDLQISSEGKHLISAHVRLNEGENPGETEKLALIADAIRRSIDGYQSIQATLLDIQAEILELSYFAQVLARGSLRLQYIPQSDDAPSGISMLLFHTQARLGSWGFGCIVRRDVREDMLQDDKRIITSSAPVILESLLWDGQLPDYENQLQERYQRILEIEENRSNVLGLGDINALIRDRLQ